MSSSGGGAIASALWGTTVEKVLFPAWESGLRRRPTLEHLAWLERSQWRSLDEITAMQVAALRRLLAHACAHVPFYRARMIAAGVGPGDVRAPEDLARIPPVRRDEMYDTAEARTSTAPPLPTIHKGTSGTTGRPLKFGYDEASEYWRQAVKLRGWGWAGYRVGKRILYYWGGSSGAPPPRSARIKTAVDRALKRERYLDCTVRSPATLDGVVDVIRRDRPDVLICFTQGAADLSRHVVERGLRTWSTIPVLCCAERLMQSDRALIREAFGDAVFETYGSREVMLIGSECAAHDGLHLSAENLLVELVVTEGGRERPAHEGEAGEVVITDLHNLGMPFIRFANGDMAVRGSSARCACGRGLPRLGAVDGRVTETLRDADGNRVSGLVFNVVFAAISETARQFQVVQHRDRALTVKVVPTATFAGGTEQRIRGVVAKYFGALPVNVEKVDDIPLTPAGKRRVVIVED